MNEASSVRHVVTICPVCNQEGQRIVCTSDNKSEIIFYHPKKMLHAVCRVGVLKGPASRAIGLPLICAVRVLLNSL